MASSTFQPPRSLLTLDTSEPLPLYSSRRCSRTDLETSSIHSSAPSYVSAAPSYHSAAPPSHRRVADTPQTTSRPGHASSTATSGTTDVTGRGLQPAPQYATGFTNRATGGVSSSGNTTDPLTPSSNLRSLYNIAEWVPATEGLQSRHYHNVAKRRASEAMNGTNLAARWAFPLIFSTVLETETGPTEGITGIDTGRRHTSPNLGDDRRDMLGSSSGNPTSSSYGWASFSGPSGSQSAGNSGSHHQHEQLPDQLEQALPLSPHEDPALVGEEAAARFRSQRLYRTYQQQVNLSSPGNNGQSRHQEQPGHPYHYSSLIPPASSSSPEWSSSQERDQRRTASPPARSASPSPPYNVDETVRSTTIDAPSTTPAIGHQTSVADFEEESKTWDWMMSQMADWEQRQRDWKRFKENFDRRLASKRGFAWVNRYVNGGNRAKLRKTQDGTQANRNTNPKKWKNKVGLAT